jgi:hypothetical protein
VGPGTPVTVEPSTTVTASRCNGSARLGTDPLRLARLGTPSGSSGRTRHRPALVLVGLAAAVAVRPADVRRSGKVAGEPRPYGPSPGRGAAAGPTTKGIE